MAGRFFETGMMFKDDVIVLHPYVYIQMLMWDISAVIWKGFSCLFQIWDHAVKLLIEWLFCDVSHKNKGSNCVPKHAVLLLPMTCVNSAN